MRLMMVRACASSVYIVFIARMSTMMSSRYFLLPSVVFMVKLVILEVAFCEDDGEDYEEDCSAEGFKRHA